MSFMDSLKNRSTSTAPSEGSDSYSIVLSQIPTDLDELQQMPQSSLSRPEYAAALAIAALCVYPVNR